MRHILQRLFIPQPVGGLSLTRALLLSKLMPWSAKSVLEHASTKPQDILDIKLLDQQRHYCVVELRDGRCRVVAQGERGMLTHSELFSRIHAEASRPRKSSERLPRGARSSLA